MIEKIRFIYTQYPFYEVIQSLKHKRNKQRMLQEDLDRLNSFIRRLQANTVESFGNSTRNGPEPRVIAPIKNTCPKYLFNNNFIISDVFKNNLQLLKKLRNKGIKIYFTSPAVVDHKSSLCYPKSPYLTKVKKYITTIKTLLAKEGFQFIGDFQHSRFSSTCFLNTHYHLRHDCAIMRTGQLIKELQASTIKPINKQPPGKKLYTLVNDDIEQLKEKLEKKSK